MDVDGITKVASRKRISADAEKLRDKVSRETENIIKLKVAQDTAYWDLKEKLQQVQSNHERLQQNMANEQMQHETTKAKYQDELKQRPEILNNTRKICDVLQDSSERLRETQSRCKADNATLFDIFNRSAEQLREMRHKQIQEDEKIKNFVEHLQEKESLSSNHHNQLVLHLTSAKQQVDGELAEARSQLATAHARKDELLTALGDMKRELEKHKNEMARKDEMMKHFQNDMKRLRDDYNVQICNAEKIVAQKSNEIQETMAACTSLKQALSNQEQFTKSVCDERNALQEKVADLEEEQFRLVAALDTLKIQLQDNVSAKATVEENLAKSTNENEDLKKEVFDHIQELTNKKQEVQDLHIQMNKLEKEKAQMDLDLRQSKEDSDKIYVQIEQLLVEKKLLEENKAEMENAAESFREIAESKQKDMEAKLQNKDKEIETKTNTINCLMSDITTAADAKFKLEESLFALRKELELEKDATKEKVGKLEKQIKVLQDSVRNKDAELSQNMSLILEIRKEKERLLEKIQDMQQTIDNVQKELTGRMRPPAGRDLPEPDDNAAMMSPRVKAARRETVQKKPEFVPTAALKRVPSGNSLFDMFSDTSSDDGRLDEGVVKRCFAAISRGETLSRSTLASLKQRPNRNIPKNQTETHQNAQGTVSNAKEDVNKRPRKFFKTKRSEAKK